MSADGRTVAVVTRTKDRALLLERAAASVREQTFKDLVWVVVNDGGASAPVEAVVAGNRAAGVETVVVHNARSLGMEGASNAGLAAADSRYVVIHDDDDSWAPGFLARTVDFLEHEPRFAGVVSGFRNIAERLRGERVHYITGWDARPVQGALQLADLVRCNPFPPICFLYRRAVLEHLGGYRDDLPVLGDWEFNLRFLERWDIAAVPDILANYHHRMGVSSGPLGNTIHAGQQRHATYDALLRNEWLRRDLAAERQGLGQLLVEGRHAHVLHTQMRPLRGLKRRARLALDRMAERLGY